MPLYKDKLRGKALQLREALKNENIGISFDEKSFRDYLLIVSANAEGRNCGKLSIYYKPSKNTYSLKKQIENGVIAKTIDGVWDALNGGGVHDAQSGIYEAFVDGSYISGVTGYGAVIYLGNERKAEISGTVNDDSFRQFAGELRSVIEVLKWCAANNAVKVRINYDYQGIEKFVTGEWKPKNNLSKEYVSFAQKAKTKTEIMWRHIKSHTGNAKNDEADALAKKAAMSASGLRFGKIEKKALAFVDFINAGEKFYARFEGSENGETAKIKILAKESERPVSARLAYSAAKGFSLKMTESGLGRDMDALWQEFLFLEDFKN